MKIKIVDKMAPIFKQYLLDFEWICDISLFNSKYSAKYLETLAIHKSGHCMIKF